MPSQHPEARKLISQGVFDSIKSFKDFEGRVTKLIETNTTLGGDAFEIFVEAYLINQPKMQCAKVFVVKQLPLDISKELNLPNDGKGVDGVYKSFSEISVPYQVKFRSNRPPLSLSEVSTFLGLTERAKDRVLITNCDEIARDVKNRDYLRSIRGQDFDLLEEADFELIEAWLKEKPVKRELPKPKPYQLIALEDIKKALGSHDRATVVMACGTGKTLIALWAAEQAEANTVLVLLPSLTLMQQTLLEWSKNNSWGNRFSFICVCSDPTVKANDEIEIDPTDIDFKVDTDPELVKQFLNQKNEKVKVVFSTYQSSKIVGEAIKGLNPFDFAVFDEAHKTTGPKGGVFAFTLDDQNISIKKRLFLTATPRHYDIKKRDKEGEFKVISMDDESIYGPRAHRLSFGSAASQGIICNYKVIISLIDKNQVDDFALKNGITLVENDKIGTRWVASQIALQQAIEKVNASKIITFHSRVKLAQEFSSETSHGIKRYLKDFKVMHVNGEQKSNERTGLIRQFKDSPRSLITNARCLTEGVDVPAVDMVAFIDARHSKVDIAQAIGRAMRKPKGSDKQFGYIVVPLFADTSDLNNLEETIKKEGFDDVAEILNALQEQDEDLVDIIKELQEAKGRGEVFNPKRLSDKVETIGPFINLEEIGTNVYTEIVNQLGVSWDLWFGLLQKYYQINKRLPEQRELCFEKYYIGRWISNQRSLFRFKDPALSESRINKLESLPYWSWNENDDGWMKFYEQLKKFSQDHPDLILSGSNLLKYGLNELDTWSANQKTNFKKKKLPKDREDLLVALPNWSFELKIDVWLNRLELAKDYAIANKHCFVPIRFKIETFKLRQWIDNQKKYYHEKNFILLEQWKIALLNNVPYWTWERDEQIYVYEEKKKLIKEYYKNNNKHPNKKYKVFINEKYNDVNLSLFVYYIRDKYKANELSNEDVVFFNNIDGWQWDVSVENFKLNYYELEKHLDAHKDVWNPLVNSRMNISLYNWLGKLRVDYFNKNLLQDNLIEIDKLQPKGFYWDPQKHYIEFGINALIKFYEDNNHLNVPVKYRYKELNIYSWVKQFQKYLKNNDGNISKEDIQRIKTIPALEAKLLK